MLFEVVWKQLTRADKQQSIRVERLAQPSDRSLAVCGREVDKDVAREDEIDGADILGEAVANAKTNILGEPAVEGEPLAAGNPSDFRVFLQHSAMG